MNAGDNITAKGARNSSIDIFRFVCASLIIVIHTNLFNDINEEIGFIFIQCLARIAVPFFFAVSGYYCFAGFAKGKSVFLQIKKLLKIYLLWSAIYSVYPICLAIIEKHKISELLSTLVNGLFLEGISEPLWYFPALIYALLLTAFSKKIRCVKLLYCVSLAVFVAAVLNCAYYKPLKDTVLFSLPYKPVRSFGIGIPFTCMGYLMNRIRIDKLTNKKLLIIESVFVILYFCEKYFINKCGFSRSDVISFSLYPLIFVTMLILLKNPLPQFGAFASVCRDTANIMYYAHPIVLAIFEVIPLKLPSYVIFSVTVALLGITGVKLHKLNKPKVNMFFK